MVLLKKFLTVSSMTLLSRILGVIREMILSRYIGASAEMDACLIAMKFPKFFRKCFSEEGFNSVFVPYFTELEVKNKNKLALLFSSRIFSIIFYAMLLLSIIVIIFAKYFVLLMAPGFCNDPEKLAITIEFTRIMFPSVLFLSLSAIYGGVLISNQKFGWYTVCPLLINIILIFSILIARNTSVPGKGLAYGVFVSTTIQYIYLYIVLKCQNLVTPKLTVTGMTSSIKQFLKKLTPVIASAGVAQINVFIDSFFSSYLFTGCVTYLYFADRLNQLPLALFGISMSIILLPEISKKLTLEHNESHSTNELQNLYRDSILFTLRLTLPVVVIISILSYYFINIIYGHGKFTQSDVYNTAFVLRIMCLGLPAYVLSKILSSILFAQKNTKTPIKAAIISISSNILLNALLTIKFHFVGIAIATMISGYIQMIVLSRYLNNTQVFDKSFIKKISKIILSTFGMAITILMLQQIEIIHITNIMVSNTLYLSCYTLIGSIVYLIILLLLHDDAILKIYNKLRKQ